MKRLALLVFIFIVFTTLPALAVDFNWDAPVDGEHVAGYKIYYGTESGTYPVFVDVGLPDAQDGGMYGSVPDVPVGVTHYFVATAYNEDAESDYSAPVEYRIPWSKPSAPSDFQPEVVLNINATNVKINIGNALAVE